MLYFFFLFTFVLLISIWWFSFTSQYWYKNLAYQLIVFILPIIFGLFTLVIISNIFPLEIIKPYKYFIYVYSSINLLLLIPQWYKFAWIQIQKVQVKKWNDNYKFTFTVFLAVLMVFAMVVFFALFYLLIYSIDGNTQGLLGALSGYQPIKLDFANSLYFSFVTYFTLGYGDLVPYGVWMRTFVFLECLSSVLNTGIIAIYVYNFLFSHRKEDLKSKIEKKTN